MSILSVNSKIDTYYDSLKKWKPELAMLREMLLRFNLHETMKWGKPCYMYQEHNLIMVLPLKNYCALLFLKGAYITKYSELFSNPEDSTSLERQLKFISIEQIEDNQSKIESIIAQAVEIEKSMVKISDKEPYSSKIPMELDEEFFANPELKNAFYNLSPSKQKSYILYFSLETTPESRRNKIRQNIPNIIIGKSPLD